jgi:uncharacterized protein (TIGR00297 family)
MDDATTKAYFDACLVDYKSARDEVLATTTQFHNTMQFGATAIVGFNAAAFALWGKEDLLVAAGFGLLIPTLASFFIGILLSHIDRIKRAGEYCEDIEGKVFELLRQLNLRRELLVRPPLNWESTIRGKTPDTGLQIAWPYALALTFFATLSAASIVIYFVYLPRIRQDVEMWSCVYGNTVLTIAMFIPLPLELLKTFLWVRKASAIATSVRGSLLEVILDAPSMKYLCHLKERLDNAFVSASATTSGVAMVVVQALVIFYSLGPAGVSMLVIVAVGGTIATVFHHLREHKLIVGEHRNWRDAIANAGVSTILALMGSLVRDYTLRHALIVGFVSSLGAAFSDTLSHELGMVFGSKPRLITTLQRARPGENGAISSMGSAIGLFSAVGIALIAARVALITFRDVPLVALAAYVGNLVDSVLGATLEKKAWVGNELVNFGCTLAAATLSIIIALELSH